LDSKQKTKVIVAGLCAPQVVLVFGLGTAAGVVGGGFLGQWLYNRRKWSLSVFIGVSIILATPPMWFIINADVQAVLGLVYCAALVSGIFSSTVAPGMRAMMMNVNEPETRGVALALQTTLDDVGKGGWVVMSWEGTVPCDVQCCGTS
jgi:predicted MFS family arabinose efflux permease